MNFVNISIVLVEPQGPRNIGSVCRSMMNFGFSDLRLVNPFADHLGKEARDMAVKAEVLLEKAVVFPDLRSALADRNVSMGTTCRYGRYRVDFLLPDEAAAFINSPAEHKKTALVFGREKHGLHTEELDLCQHFVTIPTSKDLSSMNLAQSVGLMLYELAKTKPESQRNPPGRNSLASNEELEEMFQRMRRSLLEIGYLNPQNPDHILRAFRRILGRAQLDKREVSILQGLWSKIDWMQRQIDQKKAKK